MTDERNQLNIATQIASTAGDDDLNSDAVGTTWDYCFKWQEKKLTSAQNTLQLARNAKNRKKARKKSRHKTGDDDPQASLNESTDISSPSSSSSESAVLCSYIDADNYIPAEVSYYQELFSITYEL